MHTLFIDHYIDVTNLENKVKDVASSFEERQELWQIIDEILHTQMLSLIFSVLEQKHHQIFLQHYAEAPFDYNLVDVMYKKTNVNLAPIIKNEAERIQLELLEILETV